LTITAVRLTKQRIKMSKMVCHLQRLPKNNIIKYQEPDMLVSIIFDTRIS